MGRYAQSKWDDLQRLPRTGLVFRPPYLAKIATGAAASNGICIVTTGTPTSEGVVNYVQQ